MLWPVSSPGYHRQNEETSLSHCVGPKYWKNGRFPCITPGYGLTAFLARCLANKNSCQASLKAKI